jgi:hypothetical protein
MAAAVVALDWNNLIKGLNLIKCLFNT